MMDSASFFMQAARSFVPRGCILHFLLYFANIVFMTIKNISIIDAIPKKDRNKA
jgi:hypothetical protein